MLKNKHKGDVAASTLCLKCSEHILLCFFFSQKSSDKLRNNANSFEETTTGGARILYLVFDTAKNNIRKSANSGDGKRKRIPGFCSEGHSNLRYNISLSNIEIPRVGEMRSNLTPPRCFKTTF